jgi:hypothetical protein
MLITSELRKLRQEDHKFETSLGQRNSVSKISKQKKSNYITKAP